MRVKRFYSFFDIGVEFVGFGFGVLPVITAEWLQAGSVSDTGLLLSLPVALWIANVLLINEVPDALRYSEEGHARGKIIITMD